MGLELPAGIPDMLILKAVDGRSDLAKLRPRGARQAAEWRAEPGLRTAPVVLAAKACPRSDPTKSILRVAAGPANLRLLA